MSRRALFQVCLTIVALAVLLLSGGRLSGQGRSDQAFEHVKAVQERHTERLLARPGVVGTAIGLDDNGQHVVLVLLEKDGVPDIPADLDGVPVRRRVTGTIYALPKPDKPPGLDTEIPNPPTNLVAVADGARIGLTWKDNSKNEVGFRIERADDEGEFAPIATTRKNATSYSDTVADRSIDYTYRICAFSTAGDSDYSNEAFVPAEDPAGTVPAAPTGLTATAAGSSQIDLDWADNSTSDQVIRYDVYRAQTSGSYGSAPTASVTASRYLDTGLTASTTYYYIVKAVNAAGQSGPSGEASATTDAASVPTDPPARFPRPVPIGVSTGHPTITAGTIGCRVTDGSRMYALSNNHVYAASNKAKIGDAVIQPGTYDGGTSPRDDIAALADFQPIAWYPWVNRIDAAIAEVILDSVDGQSVPRVGTSTPSGGYGTPSAETATAELGTAVQKYGRTTGLTEGTVTGVNAAIFVYYGSRIAVFYDQIMISSSTFSSGGDSGSLIVTRDGSNPVGLLFAGSATDTYANRIDLVLDRFGVTIDNGE